MPNPAGNYPGRQIFLGSTSEGNPAFVYLVTGRSDSSKGRYAEFNFNENATRIKPINPNEPFDPFRHYQAIRIDPKTGTLIISNSQAPVDALVEAYSFMPDDDKVSRRFAENLLKAIGPEYDSTEKPTSRVVGVCTPFRREWLRILAITPEMNKGFEIDNANQKLGNGLFRFVQTYNGDVNYRNLTMNELSYCPGIMLDGTIPERLANEVYDMTDYIDPTYGDLRVCATAGVLGPSGWSIDEINRWNSYNDFKDYLAERGEKK